MRERLDNRYHQTECQRVHECRRNIKLTSDSLHRILRQELKAQYQSGNTYRDIYSEQPRPVPHGQYTGGYRRTSGGRWLFRSVSARKASASQRAVAPLFLHPFFVLEIGSFRRSAVRYAPFEHGHPAGHCALMRDAGGFQVRIPCCVQVCCFQSCVYVVCFCFLNVYFLCV